MADRVVINIIPRIVSESGFSRVLSNEEIKAVGLKLPAFEKEVPSYIDCLSLLQEKLTLIQECLNATNEG